MNECKKCGEIEPENHQEILWVCDCLRDKRTFNLDEALSRVESMDFVDLAILDNQADGEVKK